MYELEKKKQTVPLNKFGSVMKNDIYCHWIDYSETVFDFVSRNVANHTLVQRRKLNPVKAFELMAKEKHRKHGKGIEEANADRNRPLFFIDFPFFIHGRISVEAGTFLNDFQELVQEKTIKHLISFMELWNSICFN
ncbi:hypothetical protein P9112_000272 [Eukaryota sp. TZLM1-RC]